MSPTVSGRTPPTTPYDPFHKIATLAPKPLKEPIRCLKPLAPLEHVYEDLFLSFEYRKAKRFIESSHGMKNDAPPKPGAKSSAEPAVHSTTTIIIIIITTTTTTTTTTTDPSSSSSFSSNFYSRCR